MTSAEPSANFERGLITLQHLGGLVLFIFNGFIVVLIIRDDDIRNKYYRKYLCSMQLTSLTFDTLFDIYSPIPLIHKGLIYSDSLLSTVIKVETFVIIEFFILAEIILSYFACVYYRRCHITSYERRFNYHGKRRIALFIFMQSYCLVSVSGFFYFVNKSVREAESKYNDYTLLLPADIGWVRNKTSFMFFRNDDNMRYATCFSFQAAATLATLIIGMLSQLANEVQSVRKTSIETSTAGAVPSLVYIIPSLVNMILQFTPTVVECGEKFDAFASVLSPLVWLIITKHTFVSSLTILYCSPSYRRKTVDFWRKSSNIIPLGLSNTNEESGQTIS